MFFFNSKKNHNVYNVITEISMSNYLNSQQSIKATGSVSQLNDTEKKIKNNNKKPFKETVVLGGDCTLEIVAKKSFKDEVLTLSHSCLSGSKRKTQWTSQRVSFLLHLYNTSSYSPSSYHLRD